MKIRIPTLAVLLMLASVTAHGAGVFTWTDSDGTTHYSESPPAGDAATSRYQLTPAPSLPALPQQRIEAFNAQADAMAEQRVKRAAQREKARRLQQKADTGQAPVDLEPQYWYPEPVIVYPPYRHHYPYGYPPPYPYPPRHHHYYDYPRNNAGKTITQQRNAEALRRYQGHPWHGRYDQR